MTHGVLGAGTIGALVVQRLVAAGVRPLVFDPQPAARESAKRAGADPRRDGADLVASADIVILCLPGSPEVEAVVDQALPYVRAGHLFINTSSCRPTTDVRCAARVAAAGARWVDSPLTRRAEGFYFMVGGAEVDCAAAAPTLEIIGARHRRIGDVGCGQIAKLMQQMTHAAEKAARLEVAAFGRRAGVDPAFLHEYLGFQIPPALLDERPGDSATLQMMYKDLGYYLELAHETGAATPLGSLVHEIFKTSTRVSDGTWDHNAIHAYYRLQNVQALEASRSPVVRPPPWR